MADIQLLILLFFSYLGWTFIKKGKPIYLYDENFISSEAKLGLLFLGIFIIQMNKNIIINVLNRKSVYYHIFNRILFIHFDRNMVNNQKIN